MNKKAFFYLPALVYVISALPLAAQSGQSFSWDLQFLKGAEPVPLANTVKMEKNETFALRLVASEDCYCYVICHDSDRNIFVMKGENLRAETEIMAGPLQITDPPGTETVYIIMSKSRQAKLEDMIKAHNNNPTSQQSTNNVYREIVSLQNSASGLGEPASTVITGGGTTRGRNSQTPGEMTQFSGKALYVRAIAIRH